MKAKVQEEIVHALSTEFPNGHGGKEGAIPAPRVHGLLLFQHRARKESDQDTQSEDSNVKLPQAPLSDGLAGCRTERLELVGRSTCEHHNQL